MSIYRTGARGDTKYQNLKRKEVNLKAFAKPI